MKIYLPTCDKYDHQLPAFAYLFNKYWGSDQTVVVCGYREPSCLPTNFTFKSLGRLETTPWTTALRTIIEQETDKYFGVLLDDYWLYAPVHRTLVNELCEMLDKDIIAKADLSNNTKNLGCDKFKGYINYVVGLESAQYRSSLQPAIWRKDYFLKLLVPGRNIWQFEIDGMALARNDGCNIVANESTIYRYANVYYKGGVVHWQLDKLSATDLQYLWDNNICRDVIKQAWYLSSKGYK